MDKAITVSLRLLRLPIGRRLILVFGMLIVSLVLYRVTFPATYLGMTLMIPLAFSGWLFGWLGGLLTVAGVSLLLGASYARAFGDTFWSSAWFAPLVAEMLCGLVVCITVGMLRRMADVLQSNRDSLAETELTNQWEYDLNELKDQAMQNLSHELRTPIAQIQGCLELLETYQDQLVPQEQARFIAYARSGCEELLSLTAAVLETVPEPGAKQSLCLNVFSLRHEMQLVVDHFGPHLLQGHHVELEIPESVQVYADPRFVRQVALNLLTNACKYTPAQTTIAVSASLVNETDALQGQAGMIRVCVSDQGPGIPLEQQSLLFQRFVRLPGAAESKQPGSGLGLAICKQLVEAMGGEIWVKSTGRSGEGCCFSFTLTNASVQVADQARCSATSANMQGRREGFV